MIWWKEIKYMALGQQMKSLKMSTKMCKEPKQFVDMSPGIDKKQVKKQLSFQFVLQEPTSLDWKSECSNPEIIPELPTFFWPEEGFENCSATKEDILPMSSWKDSGQRMFTFRVKLCLLEHCK